MQEFYHMHIITSFIVNTRKSWVFIVFKLSFVVLVLLYKSYCSFNFIFWIFPWISLFLEYLNPFYWRYNFIHYFIDLQQFYFQFFTFLSASVLLCTLHLLLPLISSSRISCRMCPFPRICGHYFELSLMGSATYVSI